MRQRAQSSCQHIVLPCVGPHPSLPLACAPQQGMTLTFLLCLDQVTLSIVACSRITLRHGRTSLQAHERAPEPCLAACMFWGTARSRSLPGTLSSVPSSGTHVESRPLASLPRLHLLLVCQGACRCWPEASLVMGLPTCHMICFSKVMAQKQDKRKGRFLQTGEQTAFLVEFVSQEAEPDLRAGSTFFPLPEPGILGSRHCVFAEGPPGSPLGRGCSLFLFILFL